MLINANNLLGFVNRDGQNMALKVVINPLKAGVLVHGHHILGYITREVVNSA